MKPLPLTTRGFILIVVLSLALGAVLASLQPGVRTIAWASFSFLFLLSFLLFPLLARWATVPHPLPPTPSASELTPDSQRTRQSLGWMLAIAFALRLFVGTALYLALPVDGYDDPDDRAGYVFTDAHRRDEQAWELASSEQSILSAFDRSFHTDQYGGLLAFCSLAYRLLSPDAHRPLLLILVTALIGSIGLVFIWKSVTSLWGEKVATAACLIFALYPESVLLGGAAMREPYLMTFSAMALWGFVGSRLGTGGSEARLDLQSLMRFETRPYVWLALGITGMLLVSPVVALVSLVIFAGWIYFTSERGGISWPVAAAALLVFLIGLFLLSSSLNRQGNFDSSSPFGVLGGFLREAVKWDVYQLERGSGWVQKLFDEMPAWLRLPFVTVYGVLQPVLPAAIVEPTTLTWKIIAILRAAGWYALLPVLVFALVSSVGVRRDATPSSLRAGSGSAEPQANHANNKIILWLAVVCWAWILLTSLRGGGDQWDNPRYRAILFTWQALVAGYTLTRLRASVNLQPSTDHRQPSTFTLQPSTGHWLLATRSRLRFTQILLCELIFLAIFTQWYASRYFHWGGQLPFAGMVALILVLWAVVLLGGRILASRRAGSA